MYYVLLEVAILFRRRGRGGDGHHTCSTLQYRVAQAWVVVFLSDLVVAQSTGPAQQLPVCAQCRWPRVSNPPHPVVEVLVVFADSHDDTIGTVIDSSH